MVARSNYFHESDKGSGASLNRLALSATVHCLVGCGIGEATGLIIGASLGWSNGATIALAVVLAFTFGYGMTSLPLFRHGLPLRQIVKIALAADTASIAVMEVVDNLVILIIPGAMDAPVFSWLFWGSLGGALGIAALAAFPVNRRLIARGTGHAVAHKFHDHH
jgi:hypothetical protein